MIEPLNAGKAVATASLLIDIENELRNLGWWDSVLPARDALNSTMPFAADTLEFYQWVQFLFLPRMHALIEQQLPLPGACGIAPMLEEYGRGRGTQPTRLLQLFAQMDALLNAG